MSQFLRNNESIVAHQRLSCCRYTLLAILRQWEIGDAGVASIEGPLGFTMADDEAASCHVSQRKCSGVSLTTEDDDDEKRPRTKWVGELRLFEPYAYYCPS